MTQDQDGQTRGTGYVVRGEVVPDDETDVSGAEQTTPMTRFQKVASALRGNRSDQGASEQETTSPDTADPNGSWQAGSDEAAAVSSPARQDDPGSEDDADAPVPDEVGAVRSPDAGNRDYGEDEEDARETGEIAGPAPDPGDAPDRALIRPDTYGPTAGTDTGTSAGRGSPAGTEAGYGSPADTAADQPGLAGTGLAGTGLAAGSGTAEATPAGKHAGPPAEADLRPGESDPALGDLSDLAYGSLLGDTADLRTQWHQIQFMFVDDPRGSVAEAADVIAQVSAKLEAAIQERLRAMQERQRSLRGRWDEGANADTETLRETLRTYRMFLDQLTGSGTG
jgi:hypothetical protein